MKIGIRFGGPKVGPEERIGIGIMNIEAVRQTLIGPLADRVSANGGKDKDAILDAIDQSSTSLLLAQIIMKDKDALLDYIELQQNLVRTGKTEITTDDIAAFVEKHKGVLK